MRRWNNYRGSGILLALHGYLGVSSFNKRSEGKLLVAHLVENGHHDGAYVRKEEIRRRQRRMMPTSNKGYKGLGYIN
eukprot:1157779-Pelagomonas_calceolata.AAC.7